MVVKGRGGGGGGREGRVNGVKLGLAYKCRASCIYGGEGERGWALAPLGKPLPILKSETAVSAPPM